MQKNDQDRMDQLAAKVRHLRWAVVVLLAVIGVGAIAANSSPAQTQTQPPQKFIQIDAVSVPGAVGSDPYIYGLTNRGEIWRLRPTDRNWGRIQMPR